MRFRILSIDDDPTVQTLLKESLREHFVISAYNLKEALMELPKTSFDAIILDIELPDGDGLRFYTEISQNEKYSQIPTLFLSGHNEISNKLMAFTLGADDFLSKPFDPLELNARIISKIKKHIQIVEDKKIQKIGDIEIDFDRQKAFQNKNGKQFDLSLTTIELKILACLSRRLEQVYTREQIISLAWGETHISDRTVDSHIAHLRTKVKNSEVQIDTVKSFGYRAILKS